MTHHHVGFDPTAWVFRLMDVNAGSEFTREQKEIINRHFISLKNELNKEVLIKS